LSIGVWQSANYYLPASKMYIDFPRNMAATDVTAMYTTTTHSAASATPWTPYGL